MPGLDGGENGATSGVGVLATFGYDDLGRRTNLARGNATSTGPGYDAASRLTGLHLSFASTSAQHDATFSYNPANQIVGTTRSNDGYAWSGGYNRNDASGIDGLNRIVNVGTNGTAYDARGNLTAIGGKAYTYGSENLLLTGPSSASLSYDPLLRLYRESSADVADTRFLYDGQSIVGEVDASGALQKRYVPGPGVDEPLVEYDASGNRTWLHADERGSIVARSDAGGTVTATNSYDEYGVPAASNVGRFGYTGQAWLRSVGLWDYKARMYAPSLGRFLQSDPIGYGDGLNWYGYVGGDPVNRTDMTGTKWAQKCVGDDCGWYWKPDASDVPFGAVPGTVQHGSSPDVVSYINSLGEEETSVTAKPKKAPQKTQSYADKVKQFEGGKVSWTGAGGSVIPLLGGGVVLDSLTTADGCVRTFETDS